MLRHPLFRVLSVSLLALLLSALVLLCLFYWSQGWQGGAEQVRSADRVSGLAFGAVVGYFRDPALMALWVALAGLLLLVWGSWHRVFLRQALIGTLVLPWLLMDILWQRELQAELTSLRQTFEGRSMHERHLGDADGALYLFTVKARRLLNDTAHGRILVSYESVEHAPRTAKAAYHLLPLAAAVVNVSLDDGSGEWASLTPLQVGDILFWIGGSSLPEFPASVPCGDVTCGTEQLLAPYLIGQGLRGEPVYAHLRKIGLDKTTPAHTHSGGSRE